MYDSTRAELGCLRLRFVEVLAVPKNMKLLGTSLAPRNPVSRFYPLTSPCAGSHPSVRAVRQHGPVRTSIGSLGDGVEQVSSGLHSLGSCVANIR